MLFCILEFKFFLEVVLFFGDSMYMFIFSGVSAAALFLDVLIARTGGASSNEVTVCRRCLFSVGVRMGNVSALKSLSCFSLINARNKKFIDLPGSTLLCLNICKCRPSFCFKIPADLLLPNLIIVYKLCLLFRCIVCLGCLFWKIFRCFQMCFIWR